MNEETVPRDRPPLGPALGELAEETLTAEGGHPAAEKLAAYALGEISGEAAEPLLDHLALCPACADFVLEVARAPASTPAPAPVPGRGAGDAPGPEALSAAAVASGWEGIRRQLVARGLLPPAPAPPIAFKRPPPRRFRLAALGSPYALAATLAALAVGLGLWNLSLRRELAERSLPRMEARVVDLFAEAWRAEGGEGEEISLAHPTTLLLHLVDPPASVRVEIRRAGDPPSAPPRWQQEQRRGAGRTENAGGDLTLLLPEGSLPAGSYRIDVLDLAGSPPVLCGSYELRVADD